MMNDPYIFLSYINTKLRDYYESLDDLCEDLNYNVEEVKSILTKINYYYSECLNRFVLKED